MNEEPQMSRALAELTANIALLRASGKSVPEEIHEKLLTLDLQGEDVWGALGGMQAGTILASYREYALMRARQIKNSLDLVKPETPTTGTPVIEQAEGELSTEAVTSGSQRRAQGRPSTASRHRA